MFKGKANFLKNMGYSFVSGSSSSCACVMSSIFKEFSCAPLFTSVTLN